MAKMRDVAVELANTGLNNGDIAAALRERFPGRTPSAASVASMLSNARASGVTVDRGGGALELPWGPTTANTVDPQEVADEETDEQRTARISRRFDVLDRLAASVARGDLRGLIVSGPPGLGKSFAVERALRARFAPSGDEASDAGPERSAPVDAGREFSDDDVDDVEPVPPYEVVRGSVSAPGLYRLLWRQRDGGVVVLDDCDDYVRDEQSLNLLKIALDTSGTRVVSWQKVATWLELEGIPRSFEFQGAVVFATNLDFEAMVNSRDRMSAHVAALLDRSLYLHLTMRSRRDILCRLRQVAVDGGMLEARGLSRDMAERAMAFVEERAEEFYRLSLRLMLQVGDAMKRDPDGWVDEVLATKTRTLR